MANKKISELPLKASPGPNDIIPIVDTSSQPYQTKKITVSSLASAGSAGPQGATGATGPQGATGVAGIQGPQGVAGIDGAPGVTGATGPQGPAGVDGVTGATGLQGATGPAGSGVTIRGTASSWPPDNSPDVGDMWIVGSPVPVGAPEGSSSGDGAVWTGMTWENVGPIRGPQGPAGLNGADSNVPGATGATGPAGSNAYSAAPDWTVNHTIADGTRYLANDLVYSGGNIYRAKFDNESEPVTNETYWENLGPGSRLNLDGRDIPNIPFPVTSVNGLTGAVTISSGNPFNQNLNTTDNVIFNDVQVNGGIVLSVLAEGITFPTGATQTTALPSPDDTFFLVSNGPEWVPSSAAAIASTSPAVRLQAGSFTVESNLLSWPGQVAMDGYALWVNNQSGQQMAMTGTGLTFPDGLSQTKASPYAYVKSTEPGVGDYYSVYPTNGDNNASGYWCVIGGGKSNTAGNYAVVGGGASNNAAAYAGTIAGGDYNTLGYTQFGRAAIGGGEHNTANGDYSAISGGKYNTASGDYSSVAGGHNNNTNNRYNAHVIGATITADVDNAAFVNNLKVVGTWDTNSSSYTGGNIALRNGTQITVGSFDNMTSGQNGLSLHCTVGYELNWQGGRLRKVASGDTSGTPLNIYVDSALEFPGTGSDNMQIDSGGITFPDGTVQTTAASSSHNHDTVVVSLAYAASLNTNASAGDIFDVTLTGNAVLENPTNPVNGKTIRWRVTQDGSGSRLVTLGNKFVIPSTATSPLTFSTTANTMDILAATYHAGRDKWDVVAFVKGY